MSDFKSRLADCFDALREKSPAPVALSFRRGGSFLDVINQTPGLPDYGERVVSSNPSTDPLETMLYGLEKWVAKITHKPKTRTIIDKATGEEWECTLKEE